MKIERKNIVGKGKSEDMEKYRKYRYSLRHFNNIRFFEKENHIYKIDFITESIYYAINRYDGFLNQLYNAAKRYYFFDYGNIKLSSTPDWGKYETSLEPIYIHNKNGEIYICFQFELPEKYIYENGYGITPVVDINEMPCCLSKGVSYAINNSIFNNQLLKLFQNFSKTNKSMKYEMNRYGIFRLLANWKQYDTIFSNIIIYQNDITHTLIFFSFEIGWFYNRFCKIEEKILKATQLKFKPRKYRFEINDFLPKYRREKDYIYINREIEDCIKYYLPPVV